MRHDCRERYRPLDMPMIDVSQAAVVEFLSSPSAHGGARVERVDTHASIVFLAGRRAWKLKRAVKYDYLDFSTLERRRVSCDAEVRINRRTAPALYRGVVAVTQEADGRLALGGRGAPVEWVIEMARFDEADVLDRLAAGGALDLRLMRPLAEAIAALHRDAEVRADHGGRAGMAWVIEGNATDLASQDAGVVDPEVRDATIAASREALARHAGLLEGRREAGRVRQCHGDLHLRNIVLLDGAPTLFDAVEFNDRIACIDVLYDLAFLLMDLWKRALARHANAVWNAYLQETGDLGGLPALPLFLSCRAAVRAKTSLAAARFQDDEGRRAALHTLSHDYLQMALAFLRPAPPRLVAIGGLSGSGKSSLAYDLAPWILPAPGAVVLRSDEIRKELLGVPASSPLGAGGYTDAVTQRVYATLAGRASAALAAGHGVIVDAVFARPDDRHAIERVAEASGARCVGLWLDAPEDVLLARVGTRRDDASDADAAIVRQQWSAGAGEVTWARIDASRDPAATTAQARDVVSA